MYDDLHQSWLPRFQQRRSILVDTTGFQPLNYFKLFFPVNLFELMAEQTCRLNNTLTIQ